MSARSNTATTEIKSWLEVILKNENIHDISVKLEGNTEVGSGYSGDIFFVEVNGTTQEKVTKKYKLLVKCGKRSPAFRSKFPVNCAFLTEINFYVTIFPYFLKFQREKGVDCPFEKVAKCYGSLVDDNLEVIVFENLKAQGYTMWDKKKPLTRQRMEMMIKEYAKFHATSMAIQDQQPKKYQQLTEKCDDFMGKIYEHTDMYTTHEEMVDEVYELLQGELDEDILSKWKNLKTKVRLSLDKFKKGLDGVHVVVHGDCWNNNFIHYQVDGQPPNFAILDWQMARPSSPIIDVAYFLFACLSEEDINDINVFLQLYYSTLSDHLRKLGSSVDKLYPYAQFLEGWKKNCKFPILMSTLIHKFSLTDGEEVPDFVQAAEDGFDIAKSMAVKIKDAPGFKKRMRYLVKYYAENDLV